MFQSPMSMAYESLSSQSYSLNLLPSTSNSHHHDQIEFESQEGFDADSSDKTYSPNKSRGPRKPVKTTAVRNDSELTIRILACANCKKRKVRCDKTAQCSTCTLYNLVCTPTMTSLNSVPIGQIKKPSVRSTRKKKLVEIATSSTNSTSTSRTRENNHRSSLTHSSLEGFPDDGDEIEAPPASRSISISPSPAFSFSPLLKLERIELPPTPPPSNNQLHYSTEESHLTNLRVTNRQTSEKEYQPRNRVVESRSETRSNNEKGLKKSSSLAIPLLDSVISRRNTLPSTYYPPSHSHLPLPPPEYLNYREEYLHPQQQFYPPQYQLPTYLPHQDYRDSYYTIPHHSIPGHIIPVYSNNYSEVFDYPPSISQNQSPEITFSQIPHFFNHYEYQNYSVPNVSAIQVNSIPSPKESPILRHSPLPAPSTDLRLPPLRNLNLNGKLAYHSGMVTGFGNESSTKLNLPSLRKWFIDEGKAGKI